MLRDLPNRRCCNTDDIRHLCSRCTAAYNAAHQESGGFQFGASNNNDTDDDDDLLIATDSMAEIIRLNEEEKRAVRNGDRFSRRNDDSYLDPTPMFD